MRISALMLMPLCVIAASCGGSSSGAPSQSVDVATPTVEIRVLPTNTAIISKIYDPLYTAPADFFVDERASTAQSYTVHHVMDESGSFEVCSDNFEAAEALEVANNASRSVNGYYVGAYENDRYYEFIRELSYDGDVGNIDDLTSPGFARVFKCDNTMRDGVDRSLLTGFAGMLNSRPLGSDTVQDFAEYLWQFAFFPQRLKKVLDSYSDPDASTPSHSLLLGFASTQGTGRCDLIEVVEWQFVADTSSGELVSQFTTLSIFEAELINGSPQLCQ